MPREFYKAAVIARAAKVSPRTIRNWARRERWPSRPVQNRIEYAPPRGLVQRCARITGPQPKPAKVRPAPPLRFPKRGTRSFAKLQLREQAVIGFEKCRRAGVGIEDSLLATSREFTFHFTVSPRALRRWVIAEARDGLLGLVEHKAGVVGRHRAKRRARARHKLT